MEWNRPLRYNARTRSVLLHAIYWIMSDSSPWYPFDIIAPASANLITSITHVSLYQSLYRLGFLLAGALVQRFPIFLFPQCFVKRQQIQMLQRQSMDETTLAGHSGNELPKHPPPFARQLRTNLSRPTFRVLACRRTPDRSCSTACAHAV